MLPFKSILSPTDFSEPSYKAIKIASELALQFKSRLVVLHVVSLAPEIRFADLPGSFDIEKYQRELEADAWKRLREVMDRLVSKELTDSIPKIASGYYPDEILRIAREEHSDLIVIGTRGRTGLPHLLLGSVAERVVQLAPCLVLTVGREVPVELPAGLLTLT